jgi:hypothetical protein
MFLVEEVAGFLREMPHSKTTYLDQFISIAASHGYAVRAVTQNSNIWVSWPRERVLIYGIDVANGGEQAADHVLQTIQEPSSIIHRAPRQNTVAATRTARVSR